MSKKNKIKNFSTGQPVQTAVAGHGVEHQVIKHDLWRILILNSIYLIGLLVLYYTNNRQHYLDNWFSKLFHF